MGAIATDAGTVTPLGDMSRDTEHAMGCDASRRLDSHRAVRRLALVSIAIARVALAESPRYDEPL